MLLYYAFAAGIIYLVKRISNANEHTFEQIGEVQSLKKLALPTTLFFIAAFLFFATPIKDKNLHVYFLDVGEGDASLVQRQSTQIVIDGGEEAMTLVREVSSKMPLFDRDIEMLVITHPHLDHFGGVFELLKRYNIKHIILPSFSASSPLYSELLELIEELDIPASHPLAGDSISVGGITFDVHNPPPALYTGTSSNIDNNGIALRLLEGEISVLFSADVQLEAETQMVFTRNAPESTLLKN